MWEDHFCPIIGESGMSNTIMGQEVSDNVDKQLKLGAPIGVPFRLGPYSFPAQPLPRSVRDRQAVVQVEFLILFVSVTGR